MSNEHTQIAKAIEMSMEVLGAAHSDLLDTLKARDKEVDALRDEIDELLEQVRELNQRLAAKEEA